MRVCFCFWSRMMQSVWFYMLVTIFVVGLIVFWDHVVIRFAGWWRQLFTMTLLLISQNSTSLDLGSAIISSSSWPLANAVSRYITFPDLCVKRPEIIRLDVDILSISLHNLFRSLYIFCISPRNYLALSEDVA